MRKIGIDVEMLDGNKHFIPLDDIIFIQVNLKISSFYLRNSTPESRITLTELWNKIEKAGIGYNHHLRKISRKHIINLDYFDRVDPDRNMVILKRDPFTMSQSESNKPKKELPQEVLKHLNAIKGLQKKSESDNKQENAPVEVPMKYYEVEIGENPMKTLTNLLKDEKRFKVIEKYASRQVLTVPVEELNGEHHMEAGYEYVDLGLTSGTLWAAYDLNKRAYHAWGDLYESEIYSEREYIHKDNHSSIVDPNTGVLSLNYDAAHHFRRGGWRIPTQAEFEELLSQCVLNWCITEDRTHGCLVTGPNGKHIFLPANGYMQGERIQKYKEYCNYWSSTNGPDNKPMKLMTHEYEGEELELISGVIKEDAYIGLSIRPVISKDCLTKQEGNPKRMLILENYFADDDDLIKLDLISTFDGWEIKRLNLPLEIDKAKERLNIVLEKYNPDVVVANKEACFWGQQIEGRYKFLIEPSWKMSEGMDAYLEDEYITEDDKASFLRLIDGYRNKEEEFTHKDISDRCWLLEEFPSGNDPQFYYCSGAELMPPLSLARWSDTQLIPIVMQVINGLYQDKDGKRTLYGKKFNLA